MYIGHGNTYPIRVDINYDNLKKGEVYYIDYKLIKEVNDYVYNNFVNKKDENIKPGEIITFDISLINNNVDNIIDYQNSEDYEKFNSSSDSIIF